MTPDNYPEGLALPLFALDIFPSQRSGVFSAAGFALTEIKMKLCSGLRKAPGASDGLLKR